MNKIMKHRILYISGLAAVVYLAINLPILIIPVFFVSLFIRLFGVQIGMHRYFCHKSFTTSKAKERFLGITSIFAMESGPIAWSIIHAHHHKYPDTIRDPHSPIHGNLHSILLWPIRSAKWFNALNMHSRLPHLYRNKFVRFIDDFYYEIWMVTLAILFVINPMLPVLLLAAGFLTAFQSNFFSAWGVHTKLPGSYVTFRVNDTSTNNKIIQFFSIGEGLHNNHHKFPQYYDQAMLSHEVDPAGWIIKKLFIGEVK